ncbi:MAG: hypothetical protein PHH59_06480 [Methylovulum sp.]|uniref:hypothetical protein n=1 Tax=Methylovulum sp. TaxID=1916980 RepID=UPI00262E40EC|nr:hypothetical protein [Methylovulum sp.]MDD2723652.1 hypothetical protein [Methylovulum sp.]MDD5123855.1 hypothetical protein [Methylovulum sp.]
MNTMTAEQLYTNLQQLPATERQRFFVMLSDAFNDKENFSHQDVFGQLDNWTRPNSRQQKRRIILKFPLPHSDGI